MSFLLSGSQQPSIPDSGVSRWKFEQDLTDSWGTYSAVASSGFSYISDSAVGSYAVSGDGSDDYIDFGNDNIFTTSPFSIAFWIRTTLSDQSFDSTARVVNKMDVGSDGFDGWTFFGGYGATVNGGIVFQLNGDIAGGERVLSTTKVNDGNWHHIVGNYDDSENEMRIYVDGQREDTYSSANPGNIDTTGQFSVFARNNTSDFFQGDVDDIRFYAKQLSDTEVSNLYSTGSI